LTNNLKNGHLRNIEHFKKYSFAMHGVYGVEGNYEIDGVWMWRGTEIPNEWKDSPSYDYFTFNKLNPKDEADQKLIVEYWLNRNEGQKVEGKDVFDAVWFH
jgi:elongation factor 1-gamma